MPNQAEIIQNGDVLFPGSTIGSVCTGEKIGNGSKNVLMSVKPNSSKQLECVLTFMTRKRITRSATRAEEPAAAGRVIDVSAVQQHGLARNFAEMFFGDDVSYHKTFLLGFGSKGVVPSLMCRSLAGFSARLAFFLVKGVAPRFAVTLITDVDLMSRCLFRPVSNFLLPFQSFSWGTRTAPFCISSVHFVLTVFFTFMPCRFIPSCHAVRFWFLAFADLLGRRLGPTCICWGCAVLLLMN